MRVNARSSLAFVHDVTASAVAWMLAYALRFNFEIPPHFLHEALTMLMFVVPLQAIIFYSFGLYQGIWRYASLPDLRRIFMAIVAAVLITPLVPFIFRLDVVYPRSVLMLDPILLLLIMGGSRMMYRTWKEHRLYGLNKLQAEPGLVLGAGDAAVSLVKDLARSREWRVVGMLDDHPRKLGRQIHGVKVLGPLDDVAQWATRLGIQKAIIALPSVSHVVRRRVVDSCTDAGLSVLTVPAFADLMSGKVTISSIRRVELDDLLGRDAVVLDDAGLHQLLSDQVVLVTGAGGSIGSELCRQLAVFNPSKLVLFESSEFALYRVEQEFRESFPQIPIVCAIGDVKNPVRLTQIMQRNAPSVVFHAAAYKHVPLMEQENVWEAVLNNVLGTYQVAHAAVEHGVKKFVMISTDKAVNPTNVMGASKRLAEMVCQALQKPASTNFVVVRFGNVLGSTGSVIPKFREQIAKGGPVTVTHPDITRYFMSIPEAAQLVLQAGCMGQGGEIFVLDMGASVRIVDLAKEMIRLSGFAEEDIKIVFTGLRPGEKLYEELLADDEQTIPTPHAKLRLAKARTADGVWLGELLAWLTTNTTRNDAEVKAMLRTLVTEYTPTGTAVAVS